MPIRSVEGFLLTLLATYATLALGVRLVDLLDPYEVATEVTRGWRVVCAVGAVGIATWAVLALVDSLLGQSAALIIGLSLLVLAPLCFGTWEASLWQQRGFLYAARVDGRAGPPEAGSRWRGVLGIPCGQPTIFEVTIGAGGTGVGTAQNYWHVPSLVLAVALAPLDGPRRMSIRAWMDGDSLQIQEPGFEPFAVPIYPR